MFNHKSLYALNKKNPNAIVYTDADGNLVFLTREDFDSEEEFLKFKEWSDNNYHTEDNADGVEAIHTVSINRLSEEAYKTESPEEKLMLDLHQLDLKHMQAETIEQIRRLLTQKQFRRIWKRYAMNMKEIDIAAEEYVSQASISECLLRGQKRICEFFVKNPIKRP